MTMQNEHLLSYLAGGLDENEKAELELALVQDADATRRLEILRRGLEPLAADRAMEAPPSGLLIATLARVAEHVCQDHTPRITRPFVPAARSWWRRADVLVGASLVAVSLMLIFPVLLLMRSSDGMRACQDRMRVCYDALNGYHKVKGKYPDVTLDVAAPRDVAGLVVPMLVDGGFLSADFHHGTPAGAALPTVEMVRAMSPEQFSTHSTQFMPGYAYHLGHRDKGVYHGPGKSMGDRAASQIPLLADAPPFDVMKGNSPNHAGRGQNVLYTDGGVRFLKDRIQNGDDIYLNKSKRVAAGLDPNDIVLGSSAARPLD